jgi:hypothetical protein
MMPIQKPFQRIGAASNAQVGRDFEDIAQRFFADQGIALQRNFAIEVGIGPLSKLHSFDLGCSTQKMLVECKCHRWTSGHNVPSAKLTVWNEAMYYFYAAPFQYKKVLFVLHDLRRGSGESLTAYYLRTFGHLVPAGVEFWEYNETSGLAQRVDI